MKMKRIAAIGLPVLLSMSLMGCGTTEDDNLSSTTTVGSTTALSTEGSASAEGGASADETASAQTAEATTESASAIAVSSVDGSLLDTSDLFTDRDLEQSADLTGATQIALVSGQEVTLTEEGVYVLRGEAEDVTVVVEADDEAKVQIVLDGVTIENENAPAIYVKSADKVFVTTTSSSNVMEVTGSYEPDGETNLDAVIFSRQDLVLNGTGTLAVVSAQGNGITSKDDLKVTGGTYSITSLMDALEANDSIRIAGGDITIVTDKDGLHSDNEDDLSLGYVYILDGTLDITADDDAIRGTSIVQVDGGVINIATCTEGIEATQIQINGGEIDIYATDDGMNASAKSNLDIMIEVNGGTINVSMAGGDTDAFDSNGALYVNEGTIDVAAPTSAFDAQGTTQLNGGTVTVNGQTITQITQSQMGGGGGPPGGPGRRG
jgi:hypothetical protein